MLNVDLQQAVQILTAYCDIEAAWVFGSTRSSRINEGGNLDIAVLFASTPSLDRLANLKDDLQRALQLDAIDLTLLNKANPILRFEAISGRSLFCRDAGRRAEFASLTAREYEDEMAQAEWWVRVRQGSIARGV